MSQNISRLPTGGQLVLPGIIAANSEPFLACSPVTINSSGFLAVVDTNELVHGYCIEDKTVTSDNETVAKYKPQCIEPWDVIIAVTASGALVQSDIGEYADISSNTAGVVVMGVPGANGLFELLEIDADDSTLGYWRASEVSRLAYAVV